MPTVSVVTAVYEPSARYFSECAASVEAQVLPAGWELEWVVQEDGPTTNLRAIVETIHGGNYSYNGDYRGVAVTRNMALMRASGELVQVLDSDDVLLNDALRILISRFRDHRIAWAIGQADDLMPDGRRLSWESALPYGIVEPGIVNNVAIEHEGNWPVHCAGLMIRTSVLRALGGWASAPTDEDVVMFAAVSEVAAGYNDPTLTWLYRQHPEQSTRSEETRQRSADGRQVALQRVEALRAVRLRIEHSVPSAGSGRTWRAGPAEKDSRLDR